ncbi:hypothetical protein IscW_ISCW000670 [Ixodes scapularis]|uniref:Uncharacterized protein n=1 Tax=Ixodes scapularis TaxID=6945 RepID=B7P6J0_IXOSC|nr:hypothetical protein IscW_ISCW000670 [Ixodes scapularis]|eukprot:XP_002408865.1 hypothetical protein IscW_ISCW000670 [Ixodes scapularis]
MPNSNRLLARRPPCEVPLDADFDSYWENESRNNNRNRIRVGRQYQATVPALLRPGESDGRRLEDLETLRWRPESLSDQSIDEYLSMAKAVSLFARAMDKWQAWGEGGPEGCCLQTALRGLSDFVTSHHGCHHDAGCQVGPTLPCHWTPTEASLFARALDECGKNFGAIKKDFGTAEEAPGVSGPEVKPMRAKPVKAAEEGPASVAPVGSLKFFLGGRLVLKLSAQEGGAWVEAQDTPRLGRPRQPPPDDASDEEEPSPPGSGGGGPPQKGTSRCTSWPETATPAPASSSAGGASASTPEENNTQNSTEEEEAGDESPPLPAPLREASPKCLPPLASAAPVTGAGTLPPPGCAERCRPLSGWRSPRGAMPFLGPLFAAQCCPTTFLPASTGPVMMAGLDELPNELLLKIFSLVDGATLVRSARVCRRWHDVVHAILEHGQTIWKMLCANEIDGEVVGELHGHVPQRIIDSCGPAGDGSCSTDWFRLYKTWHFSKVLAGLPHRTNAYPVARLDPVTCVKASRTLAVTGHSDGTVCFWDATTGAMIRLLPSHKASVNDLALVDFCCRGPYGFGSFSSNHHHVVSCSADMSVCPMPLNGHAPVGDTKVHFGEAILSISHLAVLTKYNGICMYKMWINVNGHLDLSASSRLNMGMGPTSWMGIWENTVRHVGTNRLLTTVDVCSDSLRSASLVSLCSGDGDPVTVANVCIQRKSTLIVLSVFQELYISVDDGDHFVRYPVTTLCQGPVTSLALHGSLLALGLEHGWLNVYSVPAPIDMLQLDLAHPSWSERVGKKSIISVDITHAAGCKPMVVACSSDCVFAVQFDV